MTKIKMRDDLYFILDGRQITPVSCEDWAKWFELATIDRSRVVRQEHIGPFYVSTVFLGIDHRFMGEGPPIVFETMVFDMRVPGGRMGDEVAQWRYCTYDEAERGHEKFAAQARKAVEADGNWPGDPSFKEEEDEE